MTTRAGRARGPGAGRVSMQQKEVVPEIYGPLATSPPARAPAHPPPARRTCRPRRVLWSPRRASHRCARLAYALRSASRSSHRSRRHAGRAGLDAEVGERAADLVLPAGAAARRLVGRAEHAGPLRRQARLDVGAAVLARVARELRRLARGADLDAELGERACAGWARGRQDSSTAGGRAGGQGRGRVVAAHSKWCFRGRRRGRRRRSAPWA